MKVNKIANTYGTVNLFISLVALVGCLAIMPSSESAIFTTLAITCFISFITIRSVAFHVEEELLGQNQRPTRTPKPSKKLTRVIDDLIELNSPVTIYYNGGSTPGEAREVRFTSINGNIAKGTCMISHSTKSFRLDRIVEIEDYFKGAA